MVGEIAPGAVDYLDAPLRHDVNVVLREQDVVGGEKVGAKNAQAVQKFRGAHFVILQAEAHFVPVLAQMGVNSRVQRGRPVPHHADELRCAGHHLADGEKDPNPVLSAAVVCPVKRLRIGDGLLPRLLHGAGDGAAHIHGGLGNRRTHAGLDHRVGDAVHEYAAGVREGGGPVLDHLQAGQLTAHIGILRPEIALKGNQNPGPDHGVFIRDAAPQKLLAAVGVSVHQAGHQQLSRRVDHLGRGREALSGGENTRDPLPADRDGASVRNGKVLLQKTAVFDQ